MINVNVLGSISTTFTVPILALLITWIINNDTQANNMGLICTTCKHFFFFALTWSSRQKAAHNCQNAMSRILPCTACMRIFPHFTILHFRHHDLTLPKHKISTNFKHFKFLYRQMISLEDFKTKDGGRHKVMLDG